MQKIISILKNTFGRTEPADEKNAPADVLPFRKKSVPRGYVILAKLIPPGDRKRQCPSPECSELATHFHSWYYQDKKEDGSVNLIKIFQEQEVISCYQKRCIARARRIVRKQIILAANYSLPEIFI